VGAPIAAFGPPRLASLGWVLTGLYSAFSNPVLERLGYGMANMRLARRGPIGTTVSVLLLWQRRCLFRPQVCWTQWADDGWRRPILDDCARGSSYHRATWLKLPL